MLRQTVGVGVMTLTVASSAMASGFYAGGGIGVLDLNNKSTANVTTKSSGAVTTATNNSGKMGVNGALLAGYGWSLPNRLYVGVEAFTNYTSAKISSNSTSSASTVVNSLRATYVYGARVLPGYQTTPSTVVYGILGVARGKFKTTGTVTTNKGVVTDTGAGDQNFSLNGYQLGLGSMTEVAKNVALRGDVIYTTYQNKTFNTSTSTTTTSYRVMPCTLEANAAVVYTFG